MKRQRNHYEVGFKTYAVKFSNECDNLSGVVKEFVRKLQNCCRIKTK